MKTVAFTITNDSVMVMWEGKPVTIRKGSANFQSLVNVLLSGNHDDVANHLTAHKSVADWVKVVPDFATDINTGDLFYKNEKLPDQFAAKIREMVTKGEDPSSLFNFWARLQKNPSKRSVDQLWAFLGHCGIPLTPDGCFLAYKGVREDFYDQHSGTILNQPGQRISMPRNKISDDPRAACHEGLHVGALEYAKSFAAKTIIVKVDPEHVVSVPYDSSCQKMRVCEYVVEGLYTLPLSNTVHTDDKDDYEESDEDYEEDLDDEEKSDGSEETEAKAIIVVPKKFKKIHAMDMTDLLEQSIADLRAYATHGLKLVGASKIPGGKSSLIQRILEARQHTA